MIDFTNNDDSDGAYFNAVYTASASFIEGCKSAIDFLLPDILNKKKYNQLPVLFYVANHVDILEYLKENNVDFLQKDEISRAGLLMYAITDIDDDDAFLWILKCYKEYGNIEDPTEDHITSLMTALKFGKIQRAKMLIDNGASTISVGYNKLTPLRQVFLCTEGETCVIEGLELLWPTADFSGEIKNLIENARLLKKHKILDWLEHHQ